MIYSLSGSNVVQKKGRLFGSKPDYYITIFGAGKILEYFRELRWGAARWTNSSG